MAKVSSIDQLLKEVEKQSTTILIATQKRAIIRAFERLLCLVKGECICDLCPTWDKRTFVVYEFGRCLVPTRFLQLVKERHNGTRRWSYVEALYTRLFDTLYSDLTTSEVIHSSGHAEDQSCPYKLPDYLVKQAVNAVKLGKKH